MHDYEGRRIVFLQEGRDVLHARLLASIAGFEGAFVEAHTLDARTARKVPKRAIGRVMPAEEAAGVLEKMAR